MPFYYSTYRRADDTGKRIPYGSGGYPYRRVSTGEEILPGDVVQFRDEHLREHFFVVREVVSEIDGPDIVYDPLPGNPNDEFNRSDRESAISFVLVRRQ